MFVKETALKLWHKVYINYYYIAVLENGNNRTIRSHLEKRTVKELIDDLRNGNSWYKNPIKVKEIKTCNLFKRFKNKTTYAKKFKKSNK